MKKLFIFLSIVFCSSISVLGVGFGQDNSNRCDDIFGQPYSNDICKCGDETPLTYATYLSDLEFGTTRSCDNGYWNISQSLNAVVATACPTDRGYVSVDNGDEGKSCECLAPKKEVQKGLTESGEPKMYCVLGDPKTNPDYGLRCDMTKLMHGNCGMDVYDMLGIRQSNPDTTADEFVQDIVLTATSFIGTVLTFALIVSALMIIFGGADENTASRGRKGIRYALIGYVLVLCSYLIIRLVQYVAG